MEPSDRGLFIKLLPACRVESFLDGKIYFNTDKYFAALDESDVVRFDPDEDIDESLQVKEIAIQSKETGEYVPIGGVINPIKFRYEKRPPLNIFCVFVFLEKHNFQFDERNLKFGDSAIVIRDPIEFTKRIHSASNNLGLTVNQRPVEYVQKTIYHGEIGPFRKYDDYGYQREFRYLLEPGRGEAVTLQIGDIRDICFSMLSSEITKLRPK